MATSNSRVRGSLAALGMAAVLTLSACGGAETEAAADEPTEAATLTVEDAWVVTADDGMTAAFAVFNNPSDTDIVIASAECALSPMELHEMDMSSGDMVMQEKEDGFTIPAGESHILEPGGDHLMLMELSEPILAGDEVEITLHLVDGEQLVFTAVAKDFAGADEEYNHDDHGDHGEDEHGEDEHGEE